MSRHKYRVTTFAAIIAVILFALFELFDIDSLDYFILFLGKVEHLGMDSLIGPAFLIILAVFIDTTIARRALVRQAQIQKLVHQAEMRDVARQSEIQELAREAEIQEQRLRVMHATMRTVQHIVNNFLGHIQLFRLDAEDLLDESSLTQLDNIGQQLAAELTSLGNLDETPEKESCVGIMIECEATRALA